MPRSTVREFATIPRAAISEAVYVSTNADGTAQVDFGQGAVTVAASGLYDPKPGTTVRVIQVNERTVILGPAVSRSALAEVLATGTPYLTISSATGVDGEELLPYLETYTATDPPVVGDVVVVDWSSEVILGRVSNIPTPTYSPPPPPTGSGGRRTNQFVATDSGTYYVPGATWNKNDVYVVGTGNNIGAWFYGTSIGDTIPDNAPIWRVEIYLPEAWNKHPETWTQLGLHGDMVKGGAPGVSSLAAVSPGFGWRDLPTSFGDALKTGVKRGIGSGASGEALYTGRASDGFSGMLRIEYGD
jgi:hypothetical protein